MNETERLNERLIAYLNECEPGFDAAQGLFRSPISSPGYHTTLPAGVVVCSTRENLTYAMALLASNEERWVRRGQAVVEKIVSLQDQDVCSPTYGIWSWFVEEPLSEMRPPDWNWADFCGVRLAHILVQYGELLSAGLRSKIVRSLKAAGYSIFRRNIGPGYTNIALKGAIVAAAAGELAGDSFLLEYAQQRLAKFLAFTEETGGFSEYNSPPYGVLVMTEVERGLMMIRDETVRRQLRQVHEICWGMFAATLHLPTGQMCGPQARAYHDVLTADVVAFLEEGLGFPLFHPRGFNPEVSMHGLEAQCLIPRISCPEHLKARLYNGEGVRSEWTEYHRTDDLDRYRTATTWMQGPACLGSMNMGTFWTQQHAIQGHWRVGDAVATLRVRFLHDGRDFASGVIRTSQKGNTLIAGISLATNKGDFHDHLDKPADARFPVNDLRVVIELAAPGAIALECGPGLFALSAGDYTATVQPLLAAFDGNAIEWFVAQQEEVGRAEVVAKLGGAEGLTLSPGELEEFGLGFVLSLDRTAEVGDRAAHPAGNVSRTAEEFRLSTQLVPDESSTPGSVIELVMPRKPHLFP